jgi:hypothetical protein
LGLRRNPAGAAGCTAGSVLACISEQNTIQCSEYQSAQAEARPFFDNTQMQKRAYAEALFEVFTRE